MRYDNTEFTGRAVKISEAGSAVLEVVIDSKAGQVEGVIIDAKMQPIAGVQAVLIPSNRDRVDLYYWNGFTDQTGRYSEVAVVPGDYKVFAWEGIEPFNFFDPDFMKLYEAKGRSVHIGESTVVNADIQVIPVL